MMGALHPHVAAETASTVPAGRSAICITGVATLEAAATASTVPAGRPAKVITGGATFPATGTASAVPAGRSHMKPGGVFGGPDLLEYVGKESDDVAIAMKQVRMAPYDHRILEEVESSH